MEPWLDAANIRVLCTMLNASMIIFGTMKIFLTLYVVSQMYALLQSSRLLLISPPMDSVAQLKLHYRSRGFQS